MCDTDTRSLIRCSSAGTISSVLSQETLDRRSQYRSCLYRTESEFLNNPTAETKNVSSNIVSLLPSSCKLTDDADDTQDLISSVPKSPPLITKSRVVRKTTDRGDYAENQFTITQNAFELWLVKKLKAEAVEKEREVTLKTVHLDQLDRKAKNGKSAHQTWIQEKAKIEQKQRERELKINEENLKLKKEEEDDKAQKQQKAKDSYQKWLDKKQEQVVRANERKQAEKMKQDEEVEKKKMENEKKFKEWLQKVNETNPQETSYINTKPWVPPIPKQIPHRKKNFNSPRPRTANSARPRTASSAIAIGF